MAGKVAESGSPTTFGSSPFLEIHVMPRKSVPSYRLHKPSGQARTIIDGRHVYLGKYNSPESRQRYARLLAELAQPGRDAEPVTNDIPKSLLLVSEVLVKYLKYAEVYYSDDGKPGKEFKGMVDAVALTTPQSLHQVE